MLIERGVGGAATVFLGAVGFVLAIGHYDVNAYLWLEGAFVFGTILLIVLFFSRSARPLLAKVRPLLVRLRIERPLRSSTRVCTTSAPTAGSCSTSSSSRRRSRR